MKKIIFAITLGGLILTLNIFPAMADNHTAIPAPPSKVDQILPPGIATYKGQNLPTGDLKKEIVPQAIKILLGLAGTVSFGVFVYAGIMLIIAQGNEEDITKFKNILIWSLVGLAFVMASYAIVTGIMQLVFK